MRKMGRTTKPRIKPQKRFGHGFGKNKALIKKDLGNFSSFWPFWAPWGRFWPFLGPWGRILAVLGPWQPDFGLWGGFSTPKTRIRPSKIHEFWPSEVRVFGWFLTDFWPFLGFFLNFPDFRPPQSPGILALSGRVILADFRPISRISPIFPKSLVSQTRAKLAKRQPG